MYTRCPQCSTVFRVTDRQLAIANGKVRCGKCQHIFNAREHAIDDLPLAAQSATAEKVTPAPAEKTPQPATPAVSATPKQKQTRQSSENDIRDLSSLFSSKAAETKKTAEQAPSEATFTDTDPELAAMPATDKPDINHAATMIVEPAKDDRDDFFATNIDLDAAINEITRGLDNETNTTVDPARESEIASDEFDNGPEAEDILVIDGEDNKEEKDSDDVFHTDAYDATKADSVADILEEMEAQLSLDIQPPEDAQQVDSFIENYNPDQEFDFLELDEGEEKAGKNEPAALDMDEFSSDTDEEELFTDMDLSDLHESENISEVIDNEFVTHKADKEEEDEVPLQLRDDIAELHGPAAVRIHPLLKLLVIILLLLLSVLQIAYFRAYQLVQLVPQSRPLLEQFCEQVSCHYSGPRDLSKIQLLSRDVRLHPREKNALLISASVINKAAFAQPYPNIHIRLSDISGNVVAERVFTPKTYMGKLSNPFLLMKPGVPVHINFEVIDPGKEAVNFEFSFL